MILVCISLFNHISFAKGTEGGFENFVTINIIGLVIKNTSNFIPLRSKIFTQK